MTKAIRGRVIRDTAVILTTIIVVVALALWGAWEVDFGIPRSTRIRIVAALVLVGFVLFATLFVVLVVVERSNHYQHERVSRLHLPLIVSTGALMTYFGLATIPAIDVYYEPAHQWPLMRDPTIQLITAALILVIVGAKAWLLWEILPHRAHWFRRRRAR